MEAGSELGASFLSGLVSVDGAAGYLKDTRKSNLLEQASIHHTLATVDEKLSFASPELRSYLTLDAIHNSGATHVLAAFGWSAQTVVTVKQPLNDNNNNRAKIRLYIETEFKKIESIIKTGGSTFCQYQNAEHGQAMSFEIAVYNDILSEVGRMIDFSPVFDFITGVPNNYRP